MLVKYIHKKVSKLHIEDKDGRPTIIKRKVKGPIKGVVVAEKFNGEIHVGWSLCDKHDKFDVKHGRALAAGRMLEPIEVAHSMRHHVEDMFYRAKSYYKS